MPASRTGSMLRRPLADPAPDAIACLSGGEGPVSSCVIRDLFGISREAFIAGHLGKAPLVAHDGVDPLILAGLPTAERAAALVPLLAEHPDSVRFANSGDLAARPAPRFADGAIDLEALWSRFRQGASVVLNNIYKVDTGCKALCEKLFLSLGHRVQANGYLTPASASAFTTHYDTHDVIVLQLSGRKRWHVYDRPEFLPPLPLHYDPATTPQALEAAGGREVELDTGSALYLPRGFPHRAGTQERGSFHITFALVPITGAELLKTMVEVLQYSVVALREHVSPDLFQPSSPPPDAQGLAAALIEAIEEGASRAAVQAVRTLRKEALKAARLTGAVPLDMKPEAALRLTWRDDAYSEVSEAEDGSLVINNGMKATRLSGAEVAAYRQLRDRGGLNWGPAAMSDEARLVVDRLGALGLITISPAVR
jgi:lysine-specific demethylase/histidyl-hydroxylase NO66